MKKYLLVNTAIAGLFLNITTSQGAALLTDGSDAGTIVTSGSLGGSAVSAVHHPEKALESIDIPWTYDSSLGMAVKLRGSEVVESQEVSHRIDSVIPNSETFVAGNSGTLSLTQVVVLPNGTEERLTHTVSGSKSVEYSHNDGTLQSVPKSIYRYLFGREPKLLEQLLPPIAYTAGAISRTLPTGRVLTPADTTTTLTITKNYTRPDGTTYLVDETSVALPITKTHLRYTHNDATHQSTSLQQYKVTHEGAVVTLPGEYPAAVTAHTVGAVSRVLPAGRVLTPADTITTLTITRNYTRPDGTTYSVNETSAPLPITKTHLRYTHNDASHQSTSLQQYKVTHEGAVVTLPGEYSGAATSHTRAVGATSETSRREEGTDLAVNFREPTTYTRADGTTYSQERTFTERWPITVTEWKETIPGTQKSVETFRGSRHWFTGNQTRGGKYMAQEGTFNKRIATKLDGTVVVIKDKWEVSRAEIVTGTWRVRD